MFLLTCVLFSIDPEFSLITLPIDNNHVIALVNVQEPFYHNEVNFVYFLNDNPFLSVSSFNPLNDGLNLIIGRKVERTYDNEVINGKFIPKFTEIRIVNLME